MEGSAFWRWRVWRGITPIELILIVVTIGIIAAIGIPKYRAITRDQPKIDLAIEQLDSIVSGLKRFHFDSETYNLFHRKTDTATIIPASDSSFAIFQEVFFKFDGLPYELVRNIKEPAFTDFCFIGDKDSFLITASAKDGAKTLLHANVREAIVWMF